MPTQYFKTVDTETTDRAGLKMRPNEEAILHKFPEGSTLDTIVKRVGTFFEHDRNRKLASFVESIGFDESHPKFTSFRVIIGAIRQCLSNSSHVKKTSAISDVMKNAVLREVQRRSAQGAARHGTVSAAPPPPMRITPDLVEKGWYQKSLPNLGLVFIRPKISFPETEIASLVPGVDYFGTEQEVAAHLSNTNPREVENWAKAWRELCSNGWRHEHKKDLGLVYIRPNATPHFVPDHDYFVLPRDVLAFVATSKNPSISKIADSKPAAKRPSIAENGDQSCYKRHALSNSDDSRPTALPTASNFEQQAATKPDEPQDDLDVLRNEIKNLRGCLRSIKSLLPEDEHVPAECKILFTMIRGKIPADICE